MPRRLPLVCSVHRPGAASIGNDESVEESIVGVRLRVRSLNSPLPAGCAAVAPSLRTPLAGGR